MTRESIQGAQFAIILDLMATATTDGIDGMYADTEYISNSIN